MGKSRKSTISMAIFRFANCQNVYQRDPESVESAKASREGGLNSSTINQGLPGSITPGNPINHHSSIFLYTLKCKTMGISTMGFWMNWGFLMLFFDSKNTKQKIIEGYIVQSNFYIPSQPINILILQPKPPFTGKIIPATGQSL